MRNSRFAVLAALSISITLACAQKQDPASAPEPDRGTGGGTSGGVGTSSAGLSAAPSPDAEEETQVDLSGEGHTSSPWEWGPSIRITIPVWRSNNISIRPMGSFTYLTYDGGHENRFEFGGQVRYAIREANGPTKFWIGAEAAYAILKDSYTGGSDSYDGPSATALFGFPLSGGRWNPQIVGGAGVSKYSSSGTGKNVRLGISVTPLNQ